MSFKTDRDLELFIRHFFEHHGAVLEPRETGVEALFSEDVAQRFGLPEHAVINGNGDGGDLPSVPLNYGSALLEKMAAAACDAVPVLACSLDVDYIKTGGFDRFVQDRFTFSKSVCKVDTWAETRIDYLLLACRYTAQSDEQKEGLIQIAVNQETGVCAGDIGDGLAACAKTYKTGDIAIVRDDAHLGRILHGVREAATALVMEKIVEFRESMNRRFRRDVANLDAYYAGLKAEMEQSLQRASLSDQLIKERREKIDMLPDELARKKEDLLNKYAIRVRLSPCAVLAVNAPAVKVLCRASAGRDTKNISIIYNPLTKDADPLPCAGCGAGTFSVAFCKNMHLLCPACASACPACSG